MSLNTTPLTPTQLSSCFFTPTICHFMHYNTLALSLSLQLAFHCLWTGLLLAMQLYQISIGKTTNEQINSHRLEYYVNPHDTHKEVWKRREVNPFDKGFIGNCSEFWRGGKGDSVVYSSMISFILIMQVPRDAYMRVEMDDIV